MLNAVKIKLADVSSVSPSSEQRSFLTINSFPRFSNNKFLYNV